ncbi:TonB-dependent siderophore receptor [uncultured Microbulbifer sp.]|uniref:TonB-dependent receptor plug domain-containing protein n=1 Tax=uncultured Microbulbifer sp. TaxID=348147 RepID=UPI00261E9203|nr:TonB-dependent receptor plug domain-containing protein [uncultured Microbulbifer sp.]
MKPKCLPLWIAGASIALLLHSPSQAQPNTQSDAQSEVYSPAYFASYTPQTALDMVSRLPGFSLKETDDDVRGFVAGAGNVLIDGRRPTTKSGGIEEALSRIPARLVEKIEIIRGASGLSDASGQAVLANVIRKDSTSAKRLTLSIGGTEGEDLSSDAEFGISDTFGDWESAIKLNATQERQPRAAEIRTYSNSRELTGLQKEERPSTLNEIFLSGDTKRQFSNGNQLLVNGRIGWSQYLTETTRQEAQDPQLSTASQRYFGNDRDSRYYTGEVGLEWQQPLSDQLQLRILSINNAQNWTVDSDSLTQIPLGSPASISNLAFEERKGEHVLRTLLSFTPDSPGRLSRYEFGVEAAYSHLRSWLDLSSRDLALNTPATAGGTYSQAKEQRGEVFSSATFQLSGVTLDSGLAAEYSQLAVTGDSEDQQSLFFLKPSLAMAYEAGESTQFRVDLRRSVGQLDFSDFAASADLVNDRQFSGNPRLRPDSKYRAATSVDYRFSDKGALAVTLYREWHHDVLERIILPSGASALGNAGDAISHGLNTTLNLPLSALIPNAELALNANYIDTEFEDPVTGKVRQLTDISGPSYSANFRQDISRHSLSWGVGYQSREESEEFFVNEYSYLHTRGYWAAFVETAIFDALKLRLEADQLGGEKQRWERWLYENDRSGIADTIELTERQRGARIMLTVDRAF